MPARNWILKRVRPRHYVLLQAKDSLSAAHFLISLSIDDESEYFRFRAPNSADDRFVHHRSPVKYDENSAEKNIVETILKNELPPLDVAISFDDLFADVGFHDDTEMQIPSIDDYWNFGEGDPT